MKVRFACPECRTPGRLEIPGPTNNWQCPACDHLLQADSRVTGQALPVCAICGNGELYKKKNFPHSWGLAILSVACIVSFILILRYEKVLAWAILVGSALFDVILYWWVGDAIVCYRCGAVHTGLAPGPEHKPFDLGVSERYRQERIRLEKK